MSESVGSDDGRSSKRSRHNVSQACVNCRQRKKKCDGTQPCATCVAYKDECVWGGKDDWRKPLSRSETNALRARVDELEKLVDDYRTRLELVSVPRPAATVTESAVRSPAGQKRLAPPRDRNDIENVIHDDDGTLRFLGPTSAFHRAKPTHPPSRETHRGEDKRWGRFLPDVYITKAAHDIAIDRFFRYLTSFGLRCTPHLFYRDMEVALSLSEEDIPILAPNYSPLLHNVILSLGLAYADEEYLRAGSTRRAFHDEATKRLEREIACPSLASVKGVAMRSSFSSTEGDYSVGWINNGLATRMCYALGLHVDTAPLVERGKLTREQHIERNVTFWGSFIQEECWAIYIGRMPLMGDWQTVPPPTIEPSTDDWEWAWPDQRAPACKSYLSTAFVYTTQLFRIATDITTTVYTGRYHKSDLVHDGTIQRFSDELTAWMQSLPAVLQLGPNDDDLALPHVIVLHLACSWIALLLFQPFSQVAATAATTEDVDFGKYAMTRCHRAALKTHRLANLYRKQHGLRFTAPTVAQCVYTAGTSFLLAAAQTSSTAQQKAALEHVQDMLAMLKEIGVTWHMALQKATILEELIAEYHTSTDAPAAAAAQAAAAIAATRQTAGTGAGVDGVAPGSGIPYAPSVPPATGNGAAPAWMVGAGPLPAPETLNPSPNTLEHPWSADATLDDFIQGLFSQNTLPLGSDVDLMALLHDLQ